MRCLSTYLQRNYRLGKDNIHGRHCQTVSVHKFFMASKLYREIFIFIPGGILKIGSGHVL